MIILNEYNIDYDGEYASKINKIQNAANIGGRFIGGYAGYKIGQRTKDSSIPTRLVGSLAAQELGSYAGKKAANVISKRYLKYRLKKDNISADDDTVKAIHNSKIGNDRDKTLYQVDKDKSGRRTISVIKKRKRDIIGM